MLPEPRFPGDLASELEYIASLAPKVSRSEDLIRRMERFRREHPSFDFGHRRKRF